jgi:hypothetical protein
MARRAVGQREPQLVRGDRWAGAFPARFVGDAAAFFSDPGSVPGIHGRQASDPSRSRGIRANERTPIVAPTATRHIVVLETFEQRAKNLVDSAIDAIEIFRRSRSARSRAPRLSGNSSSSSSST